VDHVALLQAYDELTPLGARLHRDMEQCGPNLGLSLSRVRLLVRRQRDSWTCRRTASCEEVSAKLASLSENVRFGSLADILTSPRHVRFTPNNGHGAAHVSIWLSVYEYTL
jgi:hypothetical protein